MLRSLALTYHGYIDITIFLCLCKLYILYGLHTCVVYLYISMYKLSMHLIVLIVYDMFDIYAYISFAMLTIVYRIRYCTYMCMYACIGI